MLPVLAALACREDMQDQPRMKPLRPGASWTESIPRTPVYGTVARDDTGTPYFNTGYNGKVLGNVIPFPVDRAVLERGRERFDIYCAPCHGRTGDGRGMIVQRGYRRPPSYHTDRLRKIALGHFFDVITNGFGAMPDYAAQVNPHDRWAIAAYIRVLQFSQNAPASMLPAGAALPESPALPGTPGSGATPAQAEPQSGNLPASEGPPSPVQRKAEQEEIKREQKDREVQPR
ncbi:MAG TPA: cytochrome c [candidate division Zixibacteria bacterium]|nr:cytochrome c [candidate division Zixibacteria bacterium]